MDFCQSEDPDYYFDSLTYSPLQTDSWDLLGTMGSSLDWKSTEDFFLYDKPIANLSGQKRKRCDHLADPGMQLSKKLKVNSGIPIPVVVDNNHHNHNRHHHNNPSSPEFYSNANSPSSPDYFFESTSPATSSAGYSPINESDFSPPIPPTMNAFPVSPVSEPKEPKIGDQHQSQVTQLLTAEEKAKYRKERSAGELLWQPDAIPQDQTNVFLQKLRNIASQSGDYLDEEKALHMLHSCNYKITDAIKQITQGKQHKSIIRKGSWSSLEAKLFEEGFTKHGKNFKKIQTEFLDKRSIGDIVQYFMLWKKSERYESWYRSEVEKNQVKIAQQIVKLDADSMDDEEEEGAGSAEEEDDSDSNNDDEEDDEEDVDILGLGPEPKITTNKMPTTITTTTTTHNHSNSNSSNTHGNRNISSSFTKAESNKLGTSSSKTLVATAKKNPTPVVAQNTKKLPDTWRSLISTPFL